MHRTLWTRLAVAAFLVATAIGTPAQTASPAPTASPAAAAPLFAALGGKPGIDSLMEEFVPRLMTDAEVGPFFKQTNAAEARKQIGDQFCVLSGGPCVYEGATMKKAHAGMGITKANFNRVVELLQQSMDARSIPFADQNRLLALLAPMHRDMIERR